MTQAWELAAAQAFPVPGALAGRRELPITSTVPGSPVPTGTTLPQCSVTGPSAQGSTSLYGVPSPNTQEGDHLGNTAQ